MACTSSLLTDTGIACLGTQLFFIYYYLIFFNVTQHRCNQLGLNCAQEISRSGVLNALKQKYPSYLLSMTPLYWWRLHVLRERSWPQTNHAANFIADKQITFIYEFCLFINGFRPPMRKGSVQTPLPSMGRLAPVDDVLGGTHIITKTW